MRAITAFFVNGVSVDYRFVSDPNSAIIAGNLISNCTANSTEFLSIKVWVHAGQQSCSSVSELDVKPAKQTDQPASQPASTTHLSSLLIVGVAHMLYFYRCARR